MRILLFGKNGQVGWELQRTLAPLGELIAVGRQEVDFLDIERLRSFTLEAKPDVIVNAAAYTDVDKAELEPDIAHTVNGAAPGILAEVSAKNNNWLVHFSTDFVFDGEKRTPYKEDDTPNPVNSYGRSKLIGEDRIREEGCNSIILRTSWVYGLRRDNFFTKVLSWSKTQPTMYIVDDQVSTPNSCVFIAEATREIIRLSVEAPELCTGRMSRLYHLTSHGSVSRWEWARKILEFDSIQPGQITREIKPVSSDYFSTAAVRPKYSVLSNEKIEKTYNITIPKWEDLLREIL